MNEANQQPEVLFLEFQNGLRAATLNRPKYLNSLNLNIFNRLRIALRQWRCDTRSRAVLVTATGRSFCAGGDVRSLYDAVVSKNLSFLPKFFTAEFNLDYQFYRYPLPRIVLMNGIVMGGGVGLTIHSDWRICTENTIWAMPENNIGLYPDVGASHFLPRLPYPNSKQPAVNIALGMYLGLTGRRLTAADAMWAGAATHYVHSSQLPDLVQALQQGNLSTHDRIQQIIERFCTEAPASTLATQATEIDEIFSKPSLQDILQLCSLRASGGSQFASDCMQMLTQRAPASLAITHAMISAGAADDYRTCIARDYRACLTAVPMNDFVIGVRAALIDKNPRPRFGSMAAAGAVLAAARVPTTSHVSAVTTPEIEQMTDMVFLDDNDDNDDDLYGGRYMQAKL